MEDPSASNERLSARGGVDEDDDFVPTKERLKLFFTIHWRGVAAVLIPLIFIPVLAPFPPEKYQWCAYTLVIMAMYWVTECIALPVTSFLPIVIFPLTGVMDSETTCTCYFNDTVFVFLGSLFLAAAVEQSGLHKRIAYCAIRLIGYSHYKLLFAMSFITMFVSMWLTNTAATTMMVPINFALLNVFEQQGLLQIYETNVDGDLVSSDFTACYFCASTFSATIGGIGTLVGTATNLAFKGLFESAYPKAPEIITFPMFSAFTIPLMLIMEFALYLWFILFYFGFLRPNSDAAKRADIPPEGIEAAKREVEKNAKELGSITFWEIMVIILFGGAIFAFFSRSPQIFVGWADALVQYFGTDKKMIADSATAMLFCFLMLYLPSTLDIFKNCKAKTYGELPTQCVPSVINWPRMDENTPYSFAFLLGGGFALSTAAGPKYTDLNGRIGDFLSGLQALPSILVLLIIIAFTIFITNFASNVAVANVVVPIGMTLAVKIDQNPLLYNLGCGLGASFCFMINVGTPGNLVVQGAANIPTKKMIVAGSVPTLTSLLLTWAGLLVYAPIIWPVIQGIPEWAKAEEKPQELF